MEDIDWAKGAGIAGRVENANIAGRAENTNIIDWIEDINIIIDTEIIIWNYNKK